LIVTSQPSEFSELLEQARRAGRTVGLHPTMGALHAGHAANVRRAALECDLAAVTIFVNPLQFGPGEDFEAYPRDLGVDLELAEAAGAGVVFCPSTEAMYGRSPLVTVGVKGLAERWEGARRPGHFDGVATVVTKLFALAGPCTAYFGEKDYQQLVVVRRLVEDLSLPVRVEACPTVREADGLALSSRNRYLGPEEREEAPGLYWALLAGKRAIEEQGVADAALVVEEMHRAVRRQPLVELEYAAVVSPEDLEPVDEVSGPARLLIAGRVGLARLIDNVAAEKEDA
jgi:pantoate--beta-alanine ligase